MLTVDLYALVAWVGTVRRVAKHRSPTDADRVAAIMIVLSGLASDVSLAQIATRLGPLHPTHDTFPGEVLVELAAEAIELSGATRVDRIDFDGIRERYLPECDAHTAAQHRKSIYALRSAAMIAGGVDPDLLGEIAWWRTDDLWLWALDALAVYVRVAAERTDRFVPEICEQLAARHQLAQH